MGGDRVKVLVGQRQSAVPQGCCEVGVYNAVPSFMENKVTGFLSFYYFICAHKCACVCVASPGIYDLFSDTLLPYA